MLIRYVGGSTHKTVALNRTERFYFRKDNDYTLDLSPKVVNHIIRTEPAGYFELIERENFSKPVEGEGEESLVHNEDGKDLEVDQGNQGDKKNDSCTHEKYKNGKCIVCGEKESRRNWFGNKK